LITRNGQCPADQEQTWFAQRHHNLLVRNAST
jgi:hypothetical protein